MSQAVNDALVMIDGQGKVLFWNHTAEKLFGYTAPEALGKEFHEMAVPAEMREKARAGVRQFSETGQGVLFGSVIETTAINRTGETFPVEVNLSSFQFDDKWFAVGTVRNITARKAMDEALKRAGDEQVAIFESLTIGIAFVKDRIILRGNAKLGELFGRPLDEMVGRTTRIWYKNEEEYLGIGASTYEDLQRQTIHQREQLLPRKDGSLFWCLFRVRAVDAQDISHGIVCTLEDITERKQAEEALREHVKEMEQFSRLTVDREEKMIQLKEEINALLAQTGNAEKYKIVE
jgi:PAS domain S-box-containing protein